MGVLKYHSRLDNILGMARTVIAELDLDKTLAVVLRKSLAVTGAQAGSIALFYPEKNSLRIHAHKGFSKHFISNREWKVRPGGLTDRILRTKGVTVITDTTQKSFFSNPLAVDEGIKSLACVPLTHQNEIVGILYVDEFRPREYSRQDLQELEILGSFAAIAILHARKHRDITRKAITDGLTGLFNRRYFEDILSREFQRSERHGREFSLALVDVNDFKRFNDRYGHQAGDEALAMLGLAIRKSIRSTDIAARYGGDEMVIILPETRLEKAYNLFSKRIKQEIESAFTRIAEDRFHLSVTIGIASFPVDGVTAHDLILAADTAMLSAKKCKDRRVIGCSRRVPGCGTAATPLPLRTAPDACSGRL